MLVKKAKKECNAVIKNIEDILRTGGINKDERIYLKHKLERLNMALKELDRIERACKESER